jgi:hypothetical protein
VRRISLLVTTIATLAVGLVGCSSESLGDARAQDDGTDIQIPAEDGGGATTAPTEAAEAETDARAGSLDPCELLSADDQSALSLGPGQEEALGGARTCLWQAPGSHTVGTQIWDNLSIDEVQSNTEPQTKTVASRRAMQYTGNLGVCAIALELTDSSRVDVTGVAGGDMDKACEVANRAAELVAPKLP